jgi:hypothetical protein
MTQENVDVGHLRTILATTTGEREITEYLKRNPWIAYWTICPASGHDRFAIYEFPLGSSFKCDLLLLNSYSGVWEAIFVEFEPVDDPVFTKKHIPSKCLAIAQRQIDDWRNYVEDNKDHIRKDLVRFAKKFDKLGYSCRREEPSNYSGNRLSDPNSYLEFKFKIIIGRSSQLSPEVRRLMGRSHGHYDLEIISYDRLLYLAEMRYENKHRENLFPPSEQV